MPREELTAKQARFCQEYMVDLNATQAALRAGYAAISAKLSGHNNITKYNCKQEIARLQANLAKKTGFTVAQAQEMYKEDRDFARKCRQPGAAVSATTGMCRLYGMDKDAGGGEKTIIIISPKAKAVESEVIDVQRQE